MFHRPAWPRVRTIGIAVAIGAALAVLASQMWSSWRTSREATRVIDLLGRLPASEVSTEKIRQELVELRLKNDDARSFFTVLFRNLGVAGALLTALSGAWIAFHQYIRLRTRERLDRAAIDLGKLWEGLSSAEPERRAGSIAGLSEFLAADKPEFNERAVSALALVGRMKNDAVVLRTLTPLVELAMRRHVEIARAVSWQGLRLFRPRLAGLDLSGFDFRDSHLGEADFSRADLRDARFDAATLVGATFDHANLSNACLTYADLARATMRHVKLVRADLRNVRLLDLDIDGADLRGATFAHHATDWRLVRNWRSATLDPDLRARLIERHGPVVSGPRILMLMWEYPPFVSGGGWTAAFHYLKALRRHGADIVVVVPMPDALIDRYLFGNEIDVIGVGQGEVFANLVDQSAYELPTPAYADIRTVAKEYQYGYAGRSLLTRVEEFQERALRVVDERRLNFDLIHAHDWLTFSTAKALSASTGRPWVAHVHSTEADRQPDRASRHVARIESNACREASRVVAVSVSTRLRLESLYDASSDRIAVIHNCFSEAGIASSNLGSYEMKTAVFLGRLTQQKGIDRFAAIAKESRIVQQLPYLFKVFGTGEQQSWLNEHSYHRHVSVPSPLVVEGFSDEDIRRGAAWDAFSDISVERNGILVPVVRQRRVAVEIFRSGFTSVTLSGSSPFTHRLELTRPADAGAAVFYVRSTRLPAVKTWQESFVLNAGPLSWERRSDAFDGASVVVVPSRFEPFGMVVLEAMRHGVPVMYPGDAGVAEVISSGVRFNPEDTKGAVARIHTLLSDAQYWHRVVDAQFEEIAGYSLRAYEERLQELWAAVAAQSPNPEPEGVSAVSRP